LKGKGYKLLEFSGEKDHTLCLAHHHKYSFQKSLTV